MLGCSKQNISYWGMHSYSTQLKKSIYRIINNSVALFELSDEEAELLANSAGLSIHPNDGNLYEFLNLHYKGKLKGLYENALISERMLRYYKKITPTKQALLAIAISLNCNLSEIDELLRKYGYCISCSVVADSVVGWFINNHSEKNRAELLLEINIVLDDMGLPLLMTRQID
jgi:hypothetical protein